MSAPRPRRQRYTRKELLTWKKPKLIKEGNKYKLRLTGTKNEMINKLLEAINNRFANKRKSKSKSKSSKKKSTIKNQSNKHQSQKNNKIIPDPTMSSQEKKTHDYNNQTNPKNSNNLDEDFVSTDDTTNPGNNDSNNSKCNAEISIQNLTNINLEKTAVNIDGSEEKNELNIEWKQYNVTNCTFYCLYKFVSNKQKIFALKNDRQQY
eukprot:319024_1